MQLFEIIRFLLEVFAVLFFYTYGRAVGVLQGKGIEETMSAMWKVMKDQGKSKKTKVNQVMMMCSECENVYWALNSHSCDQMDKTA